MNTNQNASNSTKPKLSIVISTFNRLGLLQELIASVDGKLQSIYEFVIVDDGSTDETWQYLSQLSPPTFICIRQPNRGSNAARNLGLEASIGEYVRVVDSDDLLNPEQIDKQIEYMDTHPSIDFCYSDWIKFHVQTKEQELIKAYPQEPRGIESFIHKRSLLHLIGMMVRQQVAKQVRFSLDVQRTQENEFSLWAAYWARDIAYIPGVAGTYRMHEGPRITDSGMIHGASERVQIFFKFEQALRARNELTAERIDCFIEFYCRMSERFEQINAPELAQQIHDVHLARLETIKQKMGSPSTRWRDFLMRLPFRITNKNE